VTCKIIKNLTGKIKNSPNMSPILKNRRRRAVP